jgi:HEAT repeat protein
MSRRLLAIAVLASMTAIDVASAQFLGRSAADWTHDLDAGDERARRNAAFALGKLGSAAGPTVPTLQRALTGDSSPKVREAAAFALGEIGQRATSLGKTVAGTLTTALGDEDPLVRRSALFALGSIGETTGARRDIEKLLDDKNAEVRQNAAWALGRMGSGAIGSLGTALRDPDTLVKRDAAGALGFIAQLDPTGVRAALPNLAELAKHSDAEVKKAALAAIIPCIGPEDAKADRVIQPLQKALLDGDEEVRRNAAFALCNVGGAAAAPALEVLLGALRNGDLELKRQAASGIRNLGVHAQKALPDLEDALKQNDPQLRGAAALALGGLGKVAGPAIPSLADMVCNTRELPDNRAEAATALSMIPDDKRAVVIVPRLLAVLTNPREDEKVRERVLWSLRVHNSQLAKIDGAIPALRRVLSEPTTEKNRMLRYDAAYLTGMVLRDESPAEVFPVLLEYLKESSIQVYRDKAVIVQGSGQETTGGKTTTLEVGEGDGRKLAVDCLERIGPAAVSQHPEIVAQLRRIAADERVFAGFRKQCRDLADRVEK